MCVFSFCATILPLIILPKDYPFFTISVKFDHSSTR